MKKVWDIKKSNQVKIVAIFMVISGALLLLLGVAQIRQAIKVKNSLRYTWTEVIELTQIDDINKNYSWRIFVIEVSVRKAIVSFTLSLFALTIGFMLHELRKTHDFYKKEIEAIISKNGT